MKTIRILVFCLAATMGLGGFNSAIAANPAAKVQVDVESFTLPNGMLFLVVNRPELPQVACRLTIKAGSTFESAGNTGIAHMLEHMLFKGTKNFGTTDLKQDLNLQRRIEAAYQQILYEENKPEPDQAKIALTRGEMADLREQARAIYVPNAVFMQLGKNGANNLNAMTSSDWTIYTADMPSDMLEQWFSLISEQVFEPEWREFYVEKDVVLREWAYRSANDPFNLARQNLSAAAYQASPYKHPAIGWLSDIERFSTMAAIGFHSTYYCPNNAVCVLVGNVTAEEARALAETYFERYPKGDDVIAYVTKEPEQTGSRSTMSALPGAKTPLVLIGYHGPALGSADFYAMDLLSMILDYGQSSRLQQNLVKPGLLTSASAYNPDSRFATQFILMGVPALKETGGQYDYVALCNETQDLLLNEIKKIAQDGVTEKELDRAKILVRRQFIDTLRNNGNLAFALANYEAYIGHAYLNTYLGELGKIKLEDIQTVAQKYLSENKMTVSVVIPGGAPTEAPVEYHETRVYTPSDEESEYVPQSFANHSIYKTPANWKHPLSFNREPELIKYTEAEQFTVNGAKVFYIQDDSVPLAELKLIVKAGAVDLPPDLQGLNKLLRTVIVQGGSENYNSQMLAEIMDDNAMQFSINSGLDSTTVTVSVLSETFEYALQLLAGILTMPALEEDVFNAAVQQQLAGLYMNSGNAEWLASNISTALFFGDSPYGVDALDEMRTLPQISRDDVKAFINNYFVPENMTVAFAGNVAREEVERLLHKFMSRLNQAPAPQRAVEAPVMAHSGLFLVNKPGQVQSQVILMLPAVKREDPEFWELNFLANLYGSGKDSLLLTRLRDDLGLAYSAAFGELENWQTGYFMGWIGCQGARTGLALRETVGLMASLKQGVKEKDVKRNKQMLLNSFVFNLDNNFDLATTYAGYALRGAPLDTLETIQRSFSEATAEKLTELARRFFDISKLQIVIVADKNTLVEEIDGVKVTLGDDLAALAQELGLSFSEL